ncbi:MAG: PHP domain-containing protein, partial [Ilumatobacteraceae bacterium]
MGFTNPEWTWSELEARLSGRVGPDGRAAGSPSWNAGGDAPAWSRRRQPFIAPDHRSMPEGVPYAELHCRSNFSFLEGASHPEALVVEASRLGLEAIAITDRDGLYGVVRFAEAAREMGIATMFGTEITLTGSAPTTDGLRPGGRLVLLADGTSGYARLSRAVSLGQLAGSKGAPVFELAGVAETVAG